MTVLPAVVAGLMTLSLPRVVCDFECLYCYCPMSVASLTLATLALPSLSLSLTRSLPFPLSNPPQIVPASDPVSSERSSDFKQANPDLSSYS